MNQPAGAPTFSFARLAIRFDVLAAEATTTRGLIGWLRARPVSHAVEGAMLGEVVRIEETGVVALLKVQNLSARPVLLPGDWILEGGKQARIVERSVIVGGGVSALVPVRCVERRRWASRPVADADGFTMRGPATVSSRSTFVGTRESELQRTGIYRLEQGAVWQQVSSELGASGIRSRTDSYVEFLDGAAAARARAARPGDSSELVARMPEGANGLVVLDDGDRGWIEVLPGARELRAVAPSLLAGVALAGVELPSDGIEKAVRAIQAASLVAVDTPADTLGEHLLVRGRGVVGAALLFAGELAHVAAKVDVAGA